MKKIGRCDHIVNTWKTDSCSGILKLTMTQVKPTHWKGKPWNCRASLVQRFVEPPGQVQVLLRHQETRNSSLFTYMMNKKSLLELFIIRSSFDLGFWLLKRRMLLQCVHRFVQETRTNFSHIFGIFFAAFCGSITWWWWWDLWWEWGQLYAWWRCA